MTCKKFLNYNYILNLLAYNLSYVSQMVIEKFYLSFNSVRIGNNETNATAILANSA